MACIISAIASVMKRKIYLPWGDLIFYPNMFIVLVGPPAARKGTAIQTVRRLLDLIQSVTIAADESSRQKLVDILASCEATGPIGPVEQYKHSSLTIHAAELTVTLGYNNMGLLTVLNDWFDCRSDFVYSTLSRGEKHVTNVWVNLLGATTPTLLQQALPEAAVGAGFTSRTFFVYAADKAKVVVRPTSPPGLFDDVKHDLEVVATLAGPFQYDQEFDALYHEWRQTSDMLDLGDFRLNHYVDRRATHFMKLAMIFSVSRSNELVLRAVDFQRALTFMESCERVMPHVFEGIGGNIFADVQVRMLRYIQQRGQLHESELVKAFRNDVGYRDMQGILSTLVASKEIDINQDRMVFYKGVRNNDADSGPRRPKAEAGQVQEPGKAGSGQVNAAGKGSAGTPSQSGEDNAGGHRRPRTKRVRREADGGDSSRHILPPEPQ